MLYLHQELRSSFFIISDGILMLLVVELVFESMDGISSVGFCVNTLVNCRWRISAFSLSVNRKEVLLLCMILM